ncbi:hypothetical protein BU17DRAFT_79649 [Hysterangium stoloniferum]|nr:hypothetical protein BU17DRAFT_79649 [Hysterangium stoloniferum]
MLKQIVPRHVQEMCFHEFDVPTNGLNEWLQIFRFSILTQLSIGIYHWRLRPDFDENLLTILRLTPRLRDLCIEIPYSQRLLATLREVHLPELLRLTLHGGRGLNEVLSDDESQDIMFNFFRRHNELMSLSLEGPLLSPGIFRPNSLPCLRNLKIWQHGVEIPDLLPVGFGTQLRHLKLTTIVDARCCSLLSHMTELVILDVSINGYLSLANMRALPNLQVLDLTCIRTDEEWHDVDQFFGQLYKFPNLRFLYLSGDIFGLPDASIIREKVTTILAILEGLRVEFYDDDDDDEETKIIEIQRVHDQNMRGYTTVERKGGGSNLNNNTRRSFELWTGVKYSDDFYYGGLRHR